MLLTGANSATGLRSAPCRYLFMDEIDAMQEIQGEGDPVSLAERRTTTLCAAENFVDIYSDSEGFQPDRV